MNKVSLGFSTNEYSDPELKVKASNIVINLDGNEYFPTLAPNVVTIRALITTFDDCLAKMADGGKKVTAEKNNARLNLTEALCETGRLVQNISKGDEVMILSSGFDINRKPVYVDILDQPENVIVKAGKINGTLELSWDVVDHARSYEVRYTKFPKTETSVYEKVTTTKHKIILENLIPGQQYVIQVAGVGTDPRRAWSFEITSYVM
ncbi:MAG: fibronectin type III domain-containing protein [Paludibacter sp.]|nr:fibronectin type III domain-containing protein [Paludibacter sp.]